MLNENIKRLRKLRGISQVELGNALHVSKQCISNWENDNIQPSIDMLIKIAAYFNVTTDYLLDLSAQNSLSLDGLTDEEIDHIKLLVKDLVSKK